MKVVIFCGGYGMRIRANDSLVPKPMFTIGSRPVLWHIMRYYSYFGFNDFVLCLGFGAEVIKEYFLTYRETVSNDFVLEGPDRSIALMNADTSDWRITFADTGADSSIGERLRRARKYLDGDEVFLAAYGDVVTDAPMDQIVDEFRATKAVGSLLAVPPPDSFHVIDIGDDSLIRGVEAASHMDLRINGGYFVLRQGIFEYLNEGDDLVGDALPRVARAGKFRAVRHDGFWAPMDTLKERAQLEILHARGGAPWEVWSRGEHRR
jgi:glucose-1-phosphate cytidylyltransferase